MIAPEDLKVFKDDSNNLSATIEGRGTWTKIAVRLAFPYSDPDHFASLVFNEEHVGMVRDLTELDEGSRLLLQEALLKRYHIPQVRQVLSVRELHNATHWQVVTDRGTRDFMVRDRHNFRRIKGGDLIIVDVDGNRFQVLRNGDFDQESLRLLDTYG